MPPQTARSWDARLPGLMLGQVLLVEGSMGEAWKVAATEHLLRSVLVSTGDEREEVAFRFESPRCVARELFDALAAAYGLTWRQDPQTAVTWFHPEVARYDDLLAQSIRVARDQPGLPMQSGILEAVEEATGVVVKQWAGGFRNTFDYAVDVRAGEYSLRDLLCWCCAANPTKTFHVRRRQGGDLVTAVNLVGDARAAIPPAAVDLWETLVAERPSHEPPTIDALVAALADPDPDRRHAGRNYLEATISHVDADGLARRGTSVVERLWTCIGVLSILVRSEDATHLASVEVLQEAGVEDVLADGDLGLAVITAMELARLTGDAAALEIVTARPIEGEALQPVLSDACRIAAASPHVRDLLQALHARPLVRSLAPLAAMLDSVTPGRLEFTHAPGP